MEQIEYTRTVVPSSMRSPYWKYFGFPSDSSNNILTRQKIVCTICNTTIAYNKNTSNLRTHLMSRHIELFKKIVSPSNISVVQSRNSVQANCELQSNKRKCVQNLDSNYEVNSRSRIENNSPSKCITLSDSESNEYKIITTRENVTSFATSNYETEDINFLAYFPSNGTEFTETVTCEELKNGSTMYTTNEKDKLYSDVELHEEHEQQLRSMDIMLADYIQTDLLPLDTLKWFGFSKYNQQLTGLKADDDTLVRVKGIIETRYINAEQTITLHIARLSQSTPFSLSFEIYKDSAEQDILNIYFNYLNENQTDLISVLYKSFPICSKDVNISHLLNDINLMNCSALVVTCVDDEFQFISEFANINDLPLVECLESILSRCLKRIFQETEFYREYQKFLRIILEKKNVISFGKFNLGTSSQWSPLFFLEYVFSNVEQEKIGKWDGLRESFEYLKPLKVTMDIIMDEHLPLCSLTRPLINKLFEDHFISINQKETTKAQIQKILKEELYDRIFANTFLKEITFFDIRFHSDFTLKEAFSDVTFLKAKVLKRFKNILQVTNIDQTNNVDIEQHSNNPLSIRKCSSLKTFFKRDVSSKNADLGSNFKTNLDFEFEQYCNQTCLDLDQSPVLWWEQQTDTYKQLSKISKYYLTIPCSCIPGLCRIDLEKRYSKLDRRRKLSQFCNTESKLWYLHYNEDVSQFI